MSAWWGVARGLVDPRPGGVWALGWELSPAGYRYVTTGRIVNFEPGARLLIADIVYFNPERPVLGPMQLSVTAAIAPGGCELTVRQDGYRDGPDWDWLYKAVVDAWPATLDALKVHLEAGPNG